MEWHEDTRQTHFPRPPRWPWVAVLVAIVAGGIFAFTHGNPAPAPAAEPISAVAPEQPAAEPEPPPLPPTSVTDAQVRQLLGDLFPLPGAKDLVRRFVSAVNQVADGQNPRAQLEPLAPKRGFRAGQHHGQLVIHERSYRRYDKAAGLVKALDATRVAAVFRQLEPVLDRAHEELGARDRTFRETLALAIEHLVQTPIPDGPIRLRRVRMSYKFADASLERLSAAQKQLLRMGPRNARIVQSSLRELATALQLAPTRQHARLLEPE